MELDFNKIIRLKKIRIEKSELSEEENALASPILRDKSLIRDIYKIFVELLNSRSLPPSISDNCADVVFLYQNYGDFSGDIEYLYTEIVNRLKFKGLIN